MMTRSEQATWEEAVLWLRKQPGLGHVVRESYLGHDVLAEARRFAASDEFRAVVRLLQMERSTRSRTVLDLGCGNGIASYAFARLGHTVAAMDPDLSSTVGLGAVTSIAFDVGSGTLLVAGGGAEALPFANSAFDAVYARQALHHFRSLPAGLAECARVLKPGGLMLATREHVADNDAQLEAFLGSHPLHSMYGGEHAFRLDEYQDAASAAGLECRHILGPYDSVINYYPKTAAGIRGEAVANLSRKIGAMAARIALSCRPALSAYLRRMSHFDRTPGRLYSFLFVNRGAHP